jgi:integrase
MTNYDNGSVAHLDKTKNGTERDVPLSPRALELLKILPAVKSGTLFGLSDKVRDATFRLALARATIEDLHFHDTRHLATFRLSKIFDVLELARITGHKDLKMLLVYYQTSAADLAGKF